MSDLERQTDVVIGLVTGNPLDRPRALIQEISAGMAAYFPHYSWILVHASSGRPHRGHESKERSTGSIVSIEAPRFGIHHVTHPWHGVPAKANGYRAIMELAQRRRAAVCLIVDPSQRGFERTWIDSLIRPGIHSRYDLVTPIYNGCAREQLMSGNLLAPMLRSLFGCAPRQPASGELLISARLVSRLLARHDWESAPARYTPEFWISFIAAAENYRLAESYVGPSTLQSKGPRLTFQAATEQVFGSLFMLMEQYDHRWSTIPPSTKLDRFGQPGALSRESARHDGFSYLVRFVNSFSALRGQWRSILHPHTFAEIEAFNVALREGETSRFLRDAVWVRVTYEVASAWKRRHLPRKQILGLFSPLFLARAGSFLMKTQWQEQIEVEAELVRLADSFEILRGVLRRLWCGDITAPRRDSAKTPGAVEAA